MKTYFQSRSARETSLFGPDVNLVMDRESVKSVTDAVPSISGKLHVASLGYKPPPAKKAAKIFLQVIQNLRVSDILWQSGNRPASAQQTSHVLLSSVLHLRVVSRWGEDGRMIDSYLRGSVGRTPCGRQTTPFS